MKLRAKLLPMPLRAEEQDGAFLFDGNCRISVDRELLSDETRKLFREFWNNFTFGGHLEFNGTAGSGSMKIDAALVYDYQIQVKNAEFCVTGKDENGLIHGFLTLLQLIAPVRSGEERRFYIPGCLIQDKPQISFRCIHICVFPETTLHFLKRTIRLAAMMKYSHIILEFWGMLKFDCMKELGWENAYTKEQIKELVTEANALGIEVIPMFNHLGHATQGRLKYGKHVVLDQAPEKALLFEPDGWTWCLSNPETVRLLDQVREELIELCGPGEYFHFGCDEAYSLATCDLCCGKDKRRMLTDYFNLLAQKAKQVNRKAIIWGDMLLDSQRWDDVYYALSWPEHKTHEIIDSLDHDLVIADWQYNIQDANIETAKYFQEKGFEVILCSWDDCKNIDAVGDCSKALNLSGMMATTWMTFHQKIELLLYSGENMWSDVTCLREESIASYGRRLENYQLLTAKLQRVLLPSGGDYAKAGWTERQIHI